MAKTDATSPPEGEDKKKAEPVDAQVMNDSELDILRGKGIEDAQTPTELLKAGMALVRLENSTQMQVAVQRPRNEELVLRKCLAELLLYPDMAAEAVYVKPVGKNERGVMQYAEGLSIRAAESLATRWGNCAYGAEPIEDDGETFTIGVVFLDYETNVRAARLGRISRKYKKSQRKGGGFAYHSEDRFNDIVVPAKQSKILRECILRALPSGLTKAYLKRAQELMKQQFTPAQQKMYREKLVENFAELKVTEEQLGEILGKALNMGITENELVKLRGIYNALKDGETTIEQLITDKKESLQAPASGSVEDALLAAQAQASEKDVATPGLKPEDSEWRPEVKLPPSEAPKPEEKPPATEKPEKTKPLTPKQKLVKTLLPLAKGNVNAFNKAVKQALGGELQEGIEVDTALQAFTQKQLEAIDAALKNPSEQPPTEKQGLIVPDEPSKAATGSIQPDLPPSDGSEPEKPVLTDLKGSEPESKIDTEMAELVAFIKEHGASLENKIAIIQEVCGSDLSDEALVDMAENPIVIGNKSKLRSIKNILKMMAG